LEIIVGDENETEIPPLVMVKPDIIEFDVSPVLNVMADNPAGGFIKVSVGPFALINRTDLPLKLTVLPGSLSLG
jgi:hypothetical protein